MGLVRQVYPDKRMYILRRARAGIEVIDVLNIAESSARLNITAPKQYHLASQENVDKAGGLENYIAQIKWEKQ